MLNTTFVIFLCFLFSVCVNSDEITFKNVKITGYSIHDTVKFNTTIKSSNNLKENLPTSTLFYKLEIIDQNIPVLYENSITDITKFSELILESNDIKDIKPGAFKNLRSLKEVKITKNPSLQRIQTNVFNNLTIVSLKLNRNGLKIIDDGAFDNMLNLVEIDLSHNKITALNENWFRNTPILLRVSFEANLLESLSANAFKNLQGVKVIDSTNFAVSIILSHNKIKQIDRKTFNHLQEIDSLSLDYNQISVWEADFLEDIHVNRLRLDNNKFTCFNSDINQIFRSVNKTYLDGNPWSCDCLEKMQKWVEKNETHVDLFYSRSQCSVNRILTKLNDLEAKINEDLKFFKHLL